MLEPVSDTEMRVHFAVPHGCSSARVEFHEDASRSGLSVDPQTRTLRGYGRTEPPFAVTGDKIIDVEGLSIDISYTVKVNGHNGIGWGPWSPPSKPMRLQDYANKPPAPGAPVVDQISSDSARVFCAVLPTCTHATVIFIAVDTGIELAVDHAGGNTVRDESGVIRPSFPNARYVVQRGELDFAHSQNERIRASYLLENFEPITEAGLWHLVQGEADVTEGISVVPTPGHTPHHQSVLIRSDDETACFLADVCPTSVGRPLDVHRTSV